MLGVTEDTIEDELCSDVCIDRTDDDRRDEDKCEGRFLRPRFRKRTDDRCCGVLAKIMVSHSRGDAEEDQLHNGEGGESLGEVLRPSHLGDKRGVLVGDQRTLTLTFERLTRIWPTHKNVILLQYQHIV